MSPPTPLNPVLIQTQEQNILECKVTKTANGKFEKHPQKSENHSFAEKIKCS